MTVRRVLLSFALLAPAFACSSGGADSAANTTDAGTIETDPSLPPATGSEADTAEEKAASNSDGGAGSGPAPSDPSDGYAELPVSGGADAPIVASIRVTCANGRGDLAGDPGPSAVYPAAFVRVDAVTDAQGFDDLTTGQLVLFDALSGGKRTMHQFDIRSHGIYFSGYHYKGFFVGSAGAPARASFCDAEWWPGEVTVADASGHVTKAKVRIPVVR